MLKSKDGHIEILVGSDLGQVIFPPLAWSVVNLPHDAEEASGFVKNLFNSPTSHHLCLTVHRQRKKDKIASLVNLKYFDKNWKYLDTISVQYQKPSSSSNNGFLPVAEAGHLLCKGDIPDTNTTAWFNDDVGNATNLWDVDSVEGIDNKDEKTYCLKFSSQLNLILMSMCRPLEYRKFGYFCDVDRAELTRIKSFCTAMNVTVCLYAETDSEAHKMLELLDGASK